MTDRFKELQEQKEKYRGEMVREQQHFSLCMDRSWDNYFMRRIAEYRALISEIQASQDKISREENAKRRIQRGGNDSFKLALIAALR